MVYRSPISVTRMSCERLFKDVPIFVLQIYKLQARFGNNSGLFFAWVVFPFYGWQWMIVAYPNEYGCSHDAVIVIAFDGSHLLAVLLDFVKVELITGVGAVLDVQ